MDLIDRTRPIRAGEEFNAGKVGDFLKDSIDGLSGDMVVEQFPSGHSNLTYLLRFRDRELVLRRPPFGKKAKSAHDMGREYRILRALKQAFPYCPEPLLYTEDEDIMGCPFYVMNRIRGIILRKDLPEGLVFTPAEARRLCENLIHVLIELHGVDYQRVGLGNFGKPQGYVRRQVEGWSDRYRAARTDDAPNFEQVMAWLQEKMPGESGRICIIHNDFRFDNVVLDPADPLKIIGVLDWEMATLGDPLMDLGGALAYWVEKGDPPETHLMRLVPTHLEGILSRREVVQRYAELTGAPVEKFDFYYCFGLFRLAVIAQQIYYRYYHGQTRDERFRMMIAAVHILEGTARKVIEQSDL